MNARNGVVLLGLMAMFVLAKLPTKPDRSPVLLEQALTHRQVKKAAPVAYVPVVTTTARR